VSVVTARTRTSPLREDHKARTRQALHEAAVKLFATQGYDTTTIDDIAARAGVSTRTFFRYFPTKESVLFIGERRWGESFAQVFPQQDASLTDMGAIGATLVELAPRQSRSRLRLYERAAASSAILRGQARDETQQELQVVAALIAARRGLGEPDESCALVAEVGVVTYKRALDRWLASSPDTPLGPVITDEFDLLARAFAAS